MPKTKSADLPRKMASNQKMQENKPTLKFNFTIEKGDQFQNFHFDILTEPYCSYWVFLSLYRMALDVDVDQKLPL